jgi:hypothetical protein
VNWTLFFIVVYCMFIVRIIKSRRMRFVGHVARIGEKRNAYRLLVGKPEGKRPLGRPRRRRVDMFTLTCGTLPAVHTHMRYYSFCSMFLLFSLTCMIDFIESLGSGTTDTSKNGDTPYRACKC